MSPLDLAIRGGTLVTADGPRRADLAVEEGRVAAIAPELDPGGAAEEVDAGGLHVLPGAIDAHVHFNDPGRAEWEGWSSGTRALAAGGATLALDMPLNARPPTVDGAGFDAKRRSAEGVALVDFGLWGGLVPGPLERLDELAARGAVGFKAFMCPTGVDDFAHVDDLELHDGMVRAAALDLPVAVHAESAKITSGLAARALAGGRRAVRDFLSSRPVVAELQAIARAVTLAEHTGCALHVVHVSTGRGVALVAEARRRGVDVSCETCPHYLVLDEEDVEVLGAVAKCAPPLRPAPEREGLWRGLRDGTLPMVASDHSPAPSELKGGDFWAAWGGISGAQTTLALMLSEGHHGRGLGLEQIAQVLSGFPARRFRLPGRGRLEVGAWADLVLVDLGAEHVLRAEDLQYRHPHSPYVGRSLRGRPVRTVLRGTTVWADGRAVSQPAGRLVTPDPGGAG